mgnify:FL=1
MPEIGPNCAPGHLRIRMFVDISTLFVGTSTNHSSRSDSVLPQAWVASSRLASLIWTGAVRIAMVDFPFQAFTRIATSMPLRATSHGALDLGFHARGRVDRLMND